MFKQTTEEVFHSASEEVKPEGIDRNLVKRNFLEALRASLANLPADAAVRIKLIEIVGKWNPAMVFSFDERSEVTHILVNDRAFSTFISGLKYRFFMQFTGEHEPSLKQWLRIFIEDIAMAASVDMELNVEDGADQFLSPEEAKEAFNNPENVLMPPQMVEDLPTATEIRITLSANPWLIPIMMLLAFVDLNSEVLTETPAQPENQGQQQ